MDTEKNKGSFGVWIDAAEATVVGLTNCRSGFEVVGSIQNKGGTDNQFNNAQLELRKQFFRETATLMPDMVEVHITGSGDFPGQFGRFLECLYHGKILLNESTMDRISDVQLGAFFQDYFY